MVNFQNNPEGWLKEAIIKPEKKLAFFVGAGISRDSNLPDFFEFSKEFVGGICPINWGREDSICKTLRPEVLLQVVQEIHKDRTLDFYGVLESNHPNANHFFLALALQKGHCIFTTNVDTLIEQASAMLGFPCKPLVHETDYKSFRERQDKEKSWVNFDSQLFKLHGSIENELYDVGPEKYSSIRFTLDRVGLGLAKEQREILSICLQERDFVFLGYSGNDHFSVHPVLLQTKTDQKTYWFKFRKDPVHIEFDQGIGYFRSHLKRLLDTALDGTPTMQDWEEISILEVLSKREQSFLVNSNSSQIIKEILGEVIGETNSPDQLKARDYIDNFYKGIYTNPIFSLPDWTKTITDFERHLCASMLLIRVRDFKEAEKQLKIAESYIKDSREQAAIEKLRATTFSVTRLLSKIKSSENDLKLAIKRFEKQGDLVAMFEAYLELANLMRIDRKFDSAKETLSKIERALIESEPKFKEQKRSYDWPRLMAHLFFLQGLVYGLGQRGSITDKINGINYCDKSDEFAYQAGDVARRAAALNARGLIIYQLAERSSGLLQEAEASLDNAFALHIRIGDPHRSFQPLRNRLLVQRLRTVGSKLHAKDHWLNEAQKDCDRAQKRLSQMSISGDEISADKNEIDYRQAQILGLKGNKEGARNLFQKVLEYWEGKNNLHQQARIWQDLLSLADSWEETSDCIQPLLTIIESLFGSEKERASYKNDLLRLENIRDMLIDAYIKAHDHKNQEYLRKIVTLMEQGRKIAEELGEENLSREFKIWSSRPPE